MVYLIIVPDIEALKTAIHSFLELVKLAYPKLDVIIGEFQSRKDEE